MPEPQTSDVSKPPFPEFGELRLWFDPVARSGYANMAADELLSRRSEPWLRVYGWACPAVSYGYFDTEAEARRLFPGAEEYIRRWTGGGIVDHRSGQTYTLTLPRPADGNIYPEASVLYRRIHGALAQALASHGVSCRLLNEDAPSGGRACWESPVSCDIVDGAGHKLAGAGQRRHGGAVLHQGLIQCCMPTAGWAESLAESLCPQVCLCRESEPWSGFDAELQVLLEERYLAPSWSDESRGQRYRR